MNGIYAENKAELTRNADTIMTSSSNAGNSYSIRTRLENYIQPDIAHKEKDSKLRRAIEKYTDEYRKKFEGEYSEKRKFFVQKENMKDDELFKLLQEMPKGGLLHVHGMAGLSFDRLVELCKNWNAQKAGSAYEIYVYTGETTDRLAKHTLLYKYETEKYEEAKENIQEFAGFIDANKDALKDAMCIIKNIETKEVWNQFNIKYSIFSPLFSNRNFYEDYYCDFFTECKEDRILYIEVRAGIELFQDEKAVANDQMVFGEHILRSREKFNLGEYLYYREEMMTEALGGPLTNENTEFLVAIYNAAKKAKVKVRVILTANRGSDPKADAEKIKDKMDFAINVKYQQNAGGLSDEVKKALNNLVIGFDFVNQEDTGYATCAYDDLMYEEITVKSTTGKIEKRPRIQWLPVYLHDGETNWKQGPSVRYAEKEIKIPNIIAGCICSKYRIGHGLSMVQYPELMDGIRYGISSDVNPSSDDMVLPAVEINPISNQLLKYQEDLRLHPVFQLLRAGITCVMGNDDPLIFDNPGLSYDYWMIMMDSEVTYDMVKKIVFTSYAFKALNKLGEEKGWYAILEMAQRKFWVSWDEFLGSDVVKAFCDKYCPKNTGEAANGR